MSLLFICPLDHTWVYSNRVTLSGPLGIVRIETGHARETNHMIRRLKLLSHMISAQLLISRKGLGPREWVQSQGQWFNQWYPCTETPLKVLDMKLSGASLLVNTLMWWDGEVPQLHGKRHKLYIQDSPRPYLLCLLYVPNLYPFLWNY